MNDPRSVDRLESTSGIAVGSAFVIALLYFLSVGGLSLPFVANGAVIPVSATWLWLMALAATGMVTVELFALWRNGWDVWLWILETFLEVAGVVCLYFLLHDEVFTRLLEALPSLASLPAIENAPQGIAILMAVGTLVVRGSMLVRLWQAQAGAPRDSSPSITR